MSADPEVDGGAGDSCTGDVGATNSNTNVATHKLNYKTTCVELFNVPFGKYKKIINEDVKIKNLNDMVCNDYSVFCNIKSGLEILSDLIKYSIFSGSPDWDNDSVKHIFLYNEIKTTEDVIQLNVKMPQTIDNMLLLFNSYPWCINDLNPELFTVINLENYELMTKLSLIDQSLYFSTFPEESDAVALTLCKDDTVELWVNIKTLVKKLLKRHIKIAKMPKITHGHVKIL